jgi:putative hydrolase of the HAD superfamily
MIKAVLSDLGDTLINFHHIDVLDAFRLGAQATYTFLEQEFGFELPPFERYRRRQQWAIQWAYLKSQITHREFNSTEVLKKYSQKLGLDVPEDRLEELIWQWYEPMAKMSQIDPHATPLLDELQRRGLKLAIVSNTFVPAFALDRHLERENLIRYFPLRVYSCEFGLQKPRIEIFRHTLNQLGIEPQEALFIGDSYAADIKGSRRAGMYAVYKNITAKKVTLDSATFMIRSLSEIPAIIDRINAES